LSWGHRHGETVVYGKTETDKDELNGGRETK
jgi:hypothetical protein